MTRVGAIYNILNGLKPAMLMVLVEFGLAAVNLFYKMAANDRMNLKILVAYRCIFAALSIVPFALFFERKSIRKVTWVVLFQSFLCGLFGGSLAQNLYVESLALTSATFSTAMFNLIPAITFILAISLGLERLRFGTLRGKGKVLGTLIAIGGAMFLTLYKGVEIEIWSAHLDLFHHDQSQGSNTTPSNKLLGTLLAVGCVLSFALWLIVQAKMSENYPFHYSSTALMNLMSAFQAIVFALSTEREWSQWKLGWNIRLLTAAYSGIVASGIMAVLTSWCIIKKGPLFVSVFDPLELVIVALAGPLILDEKLHLGSVLGAMLIACGLYLVLWGKSKEIRSGTQQEPLKIMSTQEFESIELGITSSPNNERNIITDAHSK